MLLLFKAFFSDLNNENPKSLSLTLRLVDEKSQRSRKIIGHTQKASLLLLLLHTTTDYSSTSTTNTIIVKLSLPSRGSNKNNFFVLSFSFFLSNQTESLSLKKSIEF